MNTGKKYKTKQKESILQCVKENVEEYSTIQQIMQRLQMKGERVGIATIYRQLDKLEQENKIAKLNIEGVNGSCFRYIAEAGQSVSINVKCEVCGKFIDIKCPQLEKLYEHIGKAHHIAINPEKTIFYGKCNECSEVQSKGE